MKSRRVSVCIFAFWTAVIFAFLLAACEQVAVQETAPVILAPAGKPTAQHNVVDALAPLREPAHTPTAIIAITTVPSTVLPVPPTSEALTRSITYISQEGDTLWALADEFGITVFAIQEANGLHDADSIYVGQELVIPLPAKPGEQVNPDTQEESVIYGLMTEIAATLETPAIRLDTSISEEAQSVPLERRALHNGDLCPLEQPVIEAGKIIGRSTVCGIPIVSFQLGNGEIPIILVGGIHGGYEWNTILLAYGLLDHLWLNPTLIPTPVTLYIVPNANPDGLYAVTSRTGRFGLADIGEVTVPGRFNGRNVDLNRNWDCEWTPSAVWRDNQISGGNEPFSESENQYLRDFILDIDPKATVFLHSAASGVFASGCGPVDPASWELGQIYSEASGYPLYEKFTYYKVTGDAGDWLASQGIPSISVELSTHESLDWNDNLEGLTALMSHLAGEP